MKLLFKSFFGGLIFYLLFYGVFLLENNATARGIATSSYICIPFLLVIVGTVFFGYRRLKKINETRTNDMLIEAINSDTGDNKEVSHDKETN